MRGDGELYSRRPCVGTQKDKYKIAWCAHWLHISALLVSQNPPTALSLFHSIELQQHPHTFVVWGTAWIPRPLTLAALHLHTSLVSMPIAWRDPRPVHAPRPCPAPHAGSQTYSSDGCCCCHWRVAWVAVAPLEEAETQSSSSTPGWKGNDNTREYPAQRQVLLFFDLKENRAGTETRRGPHHGANNNNNNNNNRPQSAEKDS